MSSEYRLREQLSAVWPEVARHIEDHHRAGRSHLLTEDVLRFVTIAELEASGLSPEQMAVEYLLPDRGKIDLVVGQPPQLAIEFKFPRDSRTGTSPDTMTLGELLKDFYRLGDHPEIAERWAVLLLNDRLVRYLQRRTDCLWSFEAGSTLRFEPSGHRLLPATAGGQLGQWANSTVEATCEAAVSLPGLRLLAYRLN